MAKGGVCRICLKEKRVMLPIFNSASKEDIDRKIMSCANVTVKMGDGLPIRICLDCLTLLLSAVIFKDTCERSDRELRKLAKVRIEDTPECFKEEEDSADQYHDFLTLLQAEEQSKDSLETSMPIPIEFEPPPVELTRKKIIPISSIIWPQPMIPTRRIIFPGRMIKSKNMTKTKRVLSPEEIAKIKRDRELRRKEYRKVYLAANSKMCSVCGKKFYNTTQFNSHMRIHTGELPFHCALCPHKSRMKASLITHIRVHTRERPFTCPHCPQTFTTASNRIKHIRTHQNYKPYKCHLCDKVYSNKPSLNTHMVVRHNKESESHFCDICEKSFKTRIYLLKHRVRNHGVRTKRRKPLADN